MSNESGSRPWTAADIASLRVSGPEIVRRVTDEATNEYTETHLEDTDPGDLVLVLPGEQLGFGGTVRRILDFDFARDSLIPSTGGAPTISQPPADRADAAKRGDDEHGVPVQRSVEVGDVVELGGLVERLAVIVEVDDNRSPPPLIPSIPGLSSVGLRRIVLATLIVAVILSGTGFGSVVEVGNLLDPSSITDSSGLGSQIDSPPPPTVTVTPPPSAPGDNQTQTPTDLTSTPSPDTQTETPTSTATVTPARTPTTTETVTQSSASTATEPTPDIDPSLHVTADDPATVRTTDGSVGRLAGVVGGELSWSGRVDSVVLVVNTWVPGDGWTEERRKTVESTSAIDLANVMDPTVVYATADRADAFANGRDGTTVTETGYVSITAVFFVDAEEVARVEETTSYDVTVENTATTADPEVDLKLGTGKAGVTFIDSDQVRPGQEGTTTGTVSNIGDADGTFVLEELPYESNENGLTEPEQKAGDDDTDVGELHEAIQLRITLERSDGSSTYVVGDDETYLPFTTVADGDVTIGELEGGESVTLVVEWRVSPKAGNEIQSDSLSVEFVFALSQQGSS